MKKNEKRQRKRKRKKKKKRGGWGYIVFFNIIISLFFFGDKCAKEWRERIKREQDEEFARMMERRGQAVVAKQPKPKAEPEAPKKLDPKSELMNRWKQTGLLADQPDAPPKAPVAIEPQARQSERKRRERERKKKGKKRS
jgi:hypothetical protein